jgi:23S rRNA pseudouridine2605 synthase
MPSVDPQTEFSASAFDPAPDAPPQPPRVERLQKVLANAGLGSRRLCEGFIAEGIVTVDGKIATLGAKVDPSTAVIHINGQRVITDTRLVYIAMNKPRGVMSTMDDEHGRKAVVDFIGELSTRVFHVGRLDADSEGLLLLTNDGTLAHKLMHPSYEIAKTYRCEIPGPVPRALGRELRAGVELEDGPAKVDEFRVIDAFGRSALVELVLHEGRNHIVRRMMEAAGFPVARLIRIAIGPIKLGDLKAGRTRRLTNGEIGALFKAVGD